MSGTCRLCLGGNFELNSIAVEDEEMRRKIDKIFYFPIFRSPQIPSLVCLNCKQLVFEFYEYAENVQKNQQSLCNLLTHEVDDHATELDACIKKELPETEWVAVDNMSDGTLCVDEEFELKEELEVEVGEAEIDHDIASTSETLQNKSVSGKEEASPRRYTLRKKRPRASSEMTNSLIDKMVLKHHKLSCDLCSIPLKDFVEMRKHFVSVHKEEPYLMCCDKKLYKKYRMVQHLQLHLNPDAFRCEICMRSYSSKKVLREHMKEVCLPRESQREQSIDEVKVKPVEIEKKAEKPAEPDAEVLVLQHHKLACDLCSVPLKDFKEQRKHYVSVHNEEPYLNCCKKKFYRKFRMVQHLQLHLDPDAFRCDICNKSYSSKRVLREHQKDVHTSKQSREVSATPIVKPKVKTSSAKPTDDELILEHFNLSCDLCQQSFNDFGDLRQHFESVHNEEPYLKCCNKKFNKKYLMVQHLQWHMNPEIFRCDICSKNCNSKRLLRDHVREVHLRDKTCPEECKSCGKMFHNRTLLKAHLRRAHLSVPCPKCPKLLSPGSLWKHLLSIHGEAQDFVCEICARCFRDKRCFQAHMKGHMGTRHEDRVQCTVCSLWLTNKYQHTKHMRRIHIEPGLEEIHQCNLCGKVMRNREALNVHKHRIHSPMKYECSYCHQKFRMRRHMKEHTAMQHTGVHLYACDHCPERFFTKNKQYTHRKSVHPVEFEEEMQKRLMMNTSNTT
ncbi:zinc finger protein 62 homolog [Topomyia yanbarensis]|uniref:zinc finger protein 62 homolog n=1 Tax=Topomyia yanbarensis TaxID=2498891 RepID=UPI00273B5A79|nr:zinc finger protein 62 homolog [Topomyia yanbarensis]